MNAIRLVWGAGIVGLLLAAGCGGGTADRAPGGEAGLGGAERSDTLVVGVGILPQQGLVEALAGDGVEVVVLIGPGHSPHAYDPTPREMAALSRVELFVTAGLPLEGPLLDRLRDLNRDMVVVDGLAGIDRLPLAEGHDCGHDHPHDHHHHAAGEPDPHFWLDPGRVRTHVRTMAEALTRVRPDRAAAIQDRLERLDGALVAVDARVAERLRPFAGRVLFVHHPAFGYFADRYGLRQVAVETGGKEPGGRQLADLIDRARAAEVRVVFVQPQFAASSAEAVAAAISGRVVAIDPLEPNLLAGLERMAEVIAEAYGAPAGGVQ